MVSSKIDRFGNTGVIEKLLFFFFVFAYNVNYLTCEPLILKYFYEFLHLFKLY